MLTLLLLACTDPAPSDDTGSADALCSSGDCPTVIGVIDALLYAEPDDAGISRGFDLDGAVSTAGGSDGCGKGDFVDPEGVPGIDNGFAALMPLLESTEAVALEGLIQDAINGGQLLLLYELEGVDDLENDPQVNLTVWRGEGVPMLGTDGAIEPGQTFDKSVDVPPAVAEGVAIENGRVEARDLELQIALQVLNADINLHFHAGGFRVEPEADGSATGFLAGGVDLADILSIAKTAGVDENLRTALIALLQASADMFPDDDDACQGISMVFDHHSVPAWFYADE